MLNLIALIFVIWCLVKIYRELGVEQLCVTLATMLASVLIIHFFGGHR